MEIFLAIIISLSAGSFGNNIISAFLAREAPDIFRSRCYCGVKVLEIKELIPVFSYFWLKGRCSFCNEKIPARYMAIELLSLAAGLLCYIKDGFTFYALYDFMTLYILLLIAITDYYEFLIPNFLIIALIILAIARAYLISAPGMTDILVMLFLPALLVLINKFFEVYRHKQALGAGDIKLLAVLSVIFHFPLNVLGLWFSSLISLPGFFILRFFNKRFRENDRIPFGLFICACFALFIFAGKELELIYLELIGVK